MRLRIWRRVSVLAQSTVSSGRVECEVAQLYEREAPRLHRMLARRVAPDKAADLVQAAFVRLLRLGEARVAELDPPEAYLSRIAINLAKDDAKIAGRRSENLHEDVDRCTIASPDPFKALEARDMLRRIEAAIPLLPERTREIFMAHRFEDLTYGDIAQRTGVSVKTVEKHISLALRTLHKALEDSP